MVPNECKSKKESYTQYMREIVERPLALSRSFSHNRFSS